ncbi:ABC transporter permease [Glaciibacter sp. 2TAF33]|uniref:ABC transporter permease n=1 Tax=Glaciibacter sp. 2TAF33 TaxID=3233015 RepID=UPI003F8FB3B1
MKKFRVSLGVIITVFVLVILYLPIGMVVANAFNANVSLIGWTGPTFHWIGDALADERVRQAAVMSFVIAALSTVVAVSLSLGAVMAVSRLPKSVGGLLQTLTYARLMVPEVVIAAGILIALRQFDLHPGMWAVVAGHIIFCSAYATLVLQARYATLTGRFDEAAADLGAPPLRVFLRVLLPMMMPAIVISSILSFTFSFDDVVSTLFLSGADIETLPVLILSLTRQGSSPEINAIAVIVVFLSIVLMSLMGLATLRPKRNHPVPQSLKEGEL